MRAAARPVSVPAVVATRSAPAVQFMLELAAALNRAGESVALNQARMERIARAYDVTDARVAVLPNMVLAAGGRGAPTALDFARCDPSASRLDRTAAIAALARQAEQRCDRPRGRHAPARRDRGDAAPLRRARA